MTQAPDRIFANGVGVYGDMSNPSNTNKHEPHEYVRADIVDGLVEALAVARKDISDGLNAIIDGADAYSATLPVIDAALAKARVTL